MQNSAPSGAQNDRGSPTQEDVLAELDRVLSSPLLQKGGKRRDFLRYIVKETLEGRADKLKGFTIAVDVFGRPETFDGASDPVVRLEARRLRRDLDSYYVDTGIDDQLRISIPKGAYIPHFEWRDVGPVDTGVDEATETGINEATGNPRDEVAPRHRMSWRAGLAIASTLLILTAVFAALVGSRSDAPLGRSAGQGEQGLAKIAMLPFEAIDGSEQSQAIAAGLDSEVVVDLRRFNHLRLYQPPKNVDTSAVLSNLRESGDMTYVIRGNVLSEGVRSDISIRLLDGATDEVVWSRTYNIVLVDGALLDLRNTLAGEIASALGQPYGALSDSMRSKSLATDAAGIASHLCVLRAYGYRRSFNRDEYGQIVSCLEQAVRFNPDYPDAWAMLAWLQLDDGRYGISGGDRNAHYLRARDTADHALSLDPENLLALKAASSIRHYLGEYEISARHARRAIEVNPHDPDALAQLGWRLAVRGNFAEGIPLLEKAIAVSLDPPGWYFHLIAVHSYLDGDYQRALDAGNRSAPNGSPVGLALVAMAATRLGQPQTAAKALSDLAPDSLMALDPAAAVRVHGANDEIAAAFATGLQEARAFVEVAVVH